MQKNRKRSQKAGFYQGLFQAKKVAGDTLSPVARFPDRSSHYFELASRNSFSLPHLHHSGFLGVALKHLPKVLIFPAGGFQIEHQVLHREPQPVEALL